MLAPTSARLGLRLAVQRPVANTPIGLLPSSRRCLNTSVTSQYLCRTPTQTAVYSRATSASIVTLKAFRSARDSSTAATQSAPAPSRSPTSSQAVMDWNAFFRLRTTRRYYSLASSLVGLVASATATAFFLTAYPDQSEFVVKLIPMDPIISTGIAVTIAMLAGWLIGPIFGNGIWRLLYRKRVPEFTAKERAFFDRIKKHRVNPSGASTNNPVPDFYGEKIGSVAGYRRWLKDQRAFNRKRMGNY